MRSDSQPLVGNLVVEVERLVGRGTAVKVSLPTAVLRESVVGAFRAWPDWASQRFWPLQRASKTRYREYSHGEWVLCRKEVLKCAKLRLTLL